MDRATGTSNGGGGDQHLIADDGVLVVRAALVEEVLIEAEDAGRKDT